MTGHLVPSLGSLLRGEAPPPRTTLPLVLVAEPSPDVGPTLQELLAPIADVRLTADRDAAAELATSLHASLVIADVTGPGFDGFDLCRRLKRAPATSLIPVVLLASRAKRDAFRQGREVGADEYLLKPFHPAEAVTRVLTLLKSVASREQTEGALHAERERAEITLTSIADGVITTDADGRVELLNPMAELLTGWTTREAGHRPLAEIFRILNRRTGTALTDLFARAMAEHSIVGRDPELVLLRRDGTEHPIADSAAPIRAHDGRVLGLVVVFHDVGREHYLADQMRQAQKMEAIGHLTGGVAHDFNNLLGVVLANAELIGASLPEERSDLRESLGDLMTAASRGRKLVRQLLGFSRQELLAVRRLDPARLLSGFLSTLRRLLPEHIEFRLTLSPEVPAIRADAGAIEHILLNLVTNARDAMPRGGRLAVDLRVGEAVEPDPRPGHCWEQAPRGPCVQIAVSDSGCGMDPQVLRQVFEPFFTTKEPGRGTGLGLAMVYGLMKQQDGWVNVNSAPGQGTTVRLHFPIAAGEERPEAAPEQPRRLVRPDGGGGTVLLVEDDAPLRRATTSVLRSLGYRVLEAEDGQDALERYRVLGASVALIVTDVVMPRLGGWDLLREIRQHDREIPFLVVSGYAGGAGAAAELSDPRVSFLEKPWTVAELAASVQHCLSSEASRRLTPPR